MSTQPIIGVDLAKDVIQVCIAHGNHIISNKELTYIQFSEWLTTTEKSTIVFEACGTSNYWKQQAITHGHTAFLISAKLVESIRQNQKTDKNDALAIIQAAQLPDTKFIPGKNQKQQQLQSMMRLRELAVKQKSALHNQIKALLLEFNIRVSTKQGGLSGCIQSALEDAENGFTTEFRDALHTAYQQYLAICISVQTYDANLESTVRSIPDCRKLLKIEGVGPINAIHIYTIFCCDDSDSFQSGKEAAACIGLTPVQHSSGGKASLGSISKRVKNNTLRSHLITGAFTYINHVRKREPRTKKEAWLKELVERRGLKCASVALANKTIRTAYSMLKNNTAYEAEALPSAA